MIGNETTLQNLSNFGILLWKFSNLETDSEKYSYLAGKVILSPGVFIGSTLVASFFLPVSNVS